MTHSDSIVSVELTFIDSSINTNGTTTIKYRHTFLRRYIDFVDTFLSLIQSVIQVISNGTTKIRYIDCIYIYIYIYIYLYMIQAIIQVITKR
jgi:hypothetical protein